MTPPIAKNPTMKRWLVPRRAAGLAATLGFVFSISAGAQQTGTSPSDVRAAIGAAYAQYIRGFAIQDAAMIAAVYDPVRGARLGDNGQVVQGAQAITADLAGFMKQTGPVTVALHTDGLWVMDDRAYEAGTWSYTFTPSGRPEQTLRGHYVTVWLHEPDGKWQMGVDMSVPGTGS